MGSRAQIDKTGVVVIGDTVWVVTCIGADGRRWWLGRQLPPTGRLERKREVTPSTVWDWIQCGRTVQFTTPELARMAIDELRGVHYERDSYSPDACHYPHLLAIEEVERDFLIATIMLVHSPGWQDDD